VTRRFPVAVVVAVLLAGTIAFAQGKGRVVKWTWGPLTGTFFVGACEGFQIWEDVAQTNTYIDRYDASGTLVQSIVHADFFSDRFYNNSVDGNEVYAVGGERQNNRVFDQPVYDGATPVEGVQQGMGPMYQITVPGYGKILGQSGMYVYDYRTGNFVSHGPSQVNDGDLAALCDYLK
jgi:hypothetical protein